MAEHRYNALWTTSSSTTRCGELFVGSCEEALHWAGRNVSYIINASDRPRGSKLKPTSNIVSLKFCCLCIRGEAVQRFACGWPMSKSNSFCF